MGQQQLLLIVLAIVIAGFATVLGLQVFAVNQKKANADALQMTAMRIAAEGQAWLRTPDTFGGGMPTTGIRPGDYTGLTVSLRDLGFSVDASDTFTDVNGSYTMAVSGADLVITATSASTSGGGDNNVICILVSGPLVQDVSSLINPPSGCP